MLVGSDRHLILPSGALLISRVRRRDEAIYHCTATNSLTYEQRISPSTIRLRLVNGLTAYIFILTVILSNSAVKFFENSLCCSQSGIC